MKILSIILLILGAAVTFTGSKIAKNFYNTEQLDDNKKVAVKLIGLVIVVIAAIIAFLN